MTIPFPSKEKPTKKNLKKYGRALDKMKTNFEQIKEEGLREFDDRYRTLMQDYLMIDYEPKILKDQKQFLQTYANKIKKAVEEDMENYE